MAGSSTGSSTGTAASGAVSRGCASSSAGSRAATGSRAFRTTRGGATVRPVIDHLALQVADVDAAAAFYTRVFAACGVREFTRAEAPHGSVVGLCGPDGRPRLWLGPLTDPGTQAVHLALEAPTREAVDVAFAAAREAGVELLHAPRVWPEYHPGYYGAFFRDLDGNNVEAVHHTSG